MLRPRHLFRLHSGTLGLALLLLSRIIPWQLLRSARSYALATAQKNPRFGSYCPYCQITSGPSSSLLPQGLKEPPSYTSATARRTPPLHADPSTDAPPPYAELSPPTTESELHPGADDDEKAALRDPAASTSKSEHRPPPAEDTLHFLDHERDSVLSLSLRYGVPAHALRRANNLHSDHLLAARRTVVIPGAWYGAGVSLSPRPVEGEAEEARKGKIRRFMVATKVADYEVAVLYLQAADYELEAAVGSFLEDERWERENPMAGDEGRAGARGRKGKSSIGSQHVQGLGSKGGTWASQVAFLRRR